MEPLALKGKAEPVAAYRLVSRARRRDGSGADASSRRWWARSGSSSAFSDAFAQRGRRAAPASCSRSSAPQASASPGWRQSSSARASRRACPARSLPVLRRGHHLLAGCRGAQAGARDDRRSGRELGLDEPRGDRDPLRARRRRRAYGSRRGDRLGGAERARGRRGGAAARRRLRRPPLGRADVPRPGRARRRPLAATHRSCSSAWPGPSCSTGARAGAAAS